MPVPHLPLGKPNQSWTFEEISNWLDAKFPGKNYGSEFVSWVRTHNNLPAPYTLNLNSSSFGPTGLGTHNTAVDWYGAWILLGNVGPGIGKILGSGIGKAGKSIPKTILPGVAAGIGKVPGVQALSGLDAIGGFFSRLSEASTWIRIGEVLAGGIVLFIGVKALSQGTPVGDAAKSVKKIGKTAIKVVPK